MTNIYYAYLLVAIYYCSETWNAMFRWSDKKADKEAGQADKGSMYMLGGTITLSIILSLIVANYIETSWMGFPPHIPALGAAVFLAGLYFRWHSIHHLGKFFTIQVAISEDHRVIDTGPYKFIRHPSYTGGLLMCLGLGLCLANPVSTAILLLLPFLAFLWRINIEETALRSALGDAYVTYSANTKRLIPFIY